MATRGIFTYYDLYGGKPKSYHYPDHFQYPPSNPAKLLSLSHTTIAAIQTSTVTTTIATTTGTTTTTTTVATNVIGSVASRLVQSLNKLYEHTQNIPFDYVYWFLFGLAILLVLLLITISISYCCTHCRKTKKLQSEKKSLSSEFYPYSKVKRFSHSYNIYDITTPRPIPSPTRPHPSNTNQYIRSHYLREDFDLIGSPKNPRLDISQTKVSNSPPNETSDLVSEIKTRLGTRASRRSLRLDHLCEIPVQRNDKSSRAGSKKDAQMIGIN